MQSGEVRRARGLAFVVLNVVGAAFTGAPPIPARPTSRQMVSPITPAPSNDPSFLGVPQCGIAILWWFGSLWRKMSIAEGGRHRLSIVRALGLISAAPCFMTANAMLSATALRLQGPPRASTLCYTLSTSCCRRRAPARCVPRGSALSRCATKDAPAWMANLGLLSAALFLRPRASVRRATRPHSRSSGSWAFITWSIWTLGVSYELWKHPRAPSRR